MKFNRRLTTTSTPDLVPMIDVVFQLVVFFLMSSTFVVSPGIALQLPGSATTEPVVTEGVNLYLYADGRLFFGEQPVTFQELEDELRSGRIPPTSPVSILAESSAEYQMVIRLLDIARGAGFFQIALRADVTD